MATNKKSSNVGASSTGISRFSGERELIVITKPMAGLRVPQGVVTFLRLIPCSDRAALQWFLFLAMKTALRGLRPAMHSHFHPKVYLT
jgi:hypothetical protein